MFSETLNTVSTFIFITFFVKCIKEGQKVRFSATENSTYTLMVKLKVKICSSTV